MRRASQLKMKKKILVMEKKEKLKRISMTI
jgi:hypothetical protein